MLNTGANVTAFDARGLCDMDVIGRWAYPSLIEEEQEPDVVTAKGTPVYCNRPAKVMLTVNRFLKLDLDFCSGRVYDIPNILSGKEFDVVFMGAILPISVIQ